MAAAVGIPPFFAYAPPPGGAQAWANALASNPYAALQQQPPMLVQPPLPTIDGDEIGKVCGRSPLIASPLRTFIRLLQFDQLSSSTSSRTKTRFRSRSPSERSSERSSDPRRHGGKDRGRRSRSRSPGRDSERERRKNGLPSHPRTDHTLSEGNSRSRSSLSIAKVCALFSCKSHNLVRPHTVKLCGARSR